MAELEDGADALVVLITFGDDASARSVARAVVGEGLAACVNIVPGVRSIYAWQGEVQDDAEVLAVVKTTRDGARALADRVQELHPYDTPEFVAIEPALVDGAYLRWLVASVRAGASGEGGAAG